MMEKNKRRCILIVFILLLIIIDQILKWYAINNNQEIIKGVLNFTTVENTGGAFGVGQGNISTFIITNIIVLGVIIRFMVVQEERIDKKTFCALCLVLAGGISNLIDRIFRGFVVDFIDFSTIINFPKFNLADAYITIGWILLAACFAITTWKEIKERKK